MMRALPPDHRQTVVGSRRANHGRANSDGKLRGGHADAAAGAVNQHDVARSRISAAKHRAPRGHVRHKQPRTLRKRNAIGKPMDLLRQADRVLRVGAVRFTRGGAADIDAIAGLPLRDSFADPVDDAGGVRTWRIGKIGLYRVSTGAHVGVIRIDADGMHANAHLAASGYGIGDFFELEDFWTAKFTRENRLHPAITSRARALRQ